MSSRVPVIVVAKPERDRGVDLIDVSSSKIVASLQMLDYRRCRRLVKEIWKLRKHFLREVTDLLVRPSTRFAQGEDRRELLRCQTAGGLAISFRNFGDEVSVGAMAVATSIDVTVPG